MSRTTREGVVIFSLDGALDRDGIGGIKPWLDQVIEEGVRGILIDFTRVGGIDVYGLGYLLSAYGRSQQRNVPFKLTCLHPRVARSFLDVKLNLVFEMFDNVETALKTYGKKSEERRAKSEN